MIGISFLLQEIMKLPGSSCFGPRLFLILIRRGRSAHRIRQRQHMCDRRKSIIISAVGIVVIGKVLEYQTCPAIPRIVHFPGIFVIVKILNDLLCCRLLLHHILKGYVSVSVQDQHDDILPRRHTKLLLTGQCIHLLFLHTIRIGKKQTENRNSLYQYQKCRDPCHDLFRIAFRILRYDTGNGRSSPNNRSLPARNDNDHHTDPVNPRDHPSFRRIPPMKSDRLRKRIISYQ